MKMGGEGGDFVSCFPKGWFILLYSIFNIKSIVNVKKIVCFLFFFRKWASSFIYEFFN